MPKISSDQPDAEDISLVHETRFLRPQLPSFEASPEEVRAFLKAILMTSYQVDGETAQKICDKWTIGSGRELRIYPPSVYGEIFGPVNAWAIYLEVKPLALAESRHSARSIRLNKREQLSSSTNASVIWVWKTAD